MAGAFSAAIRKKVARTIHSPENQASPNNSNNNIMRTRPSFRAVGKLSRSFLNQPPLTPFQKFKRSIFLTFEDPQYSVLAKTMNFAVLILILFSTMVFLLETLPQLDPKSVSDPDQSAWLENFWNTCEAVVVAFFTGEYVVRLLTCPKLKDFLMNRMNFVDILAIFPYFFELILDAFGSVGVQVSNFRILRIVRLFRVFRLFKLSKHSEHFSVFMETLRKSRDALLMLTFILCLTVIVFAGIMHILEKADYDATSHMYIRADGTKVAYDPFRSVPEAAWWAIATLTTVGYGDAVPVSPGGKAVAPIAMLAGILTIAMPLGIIGENLMETYRHNAKISAPKGDNLIGSATPDNLEDLTEYLAMTREEIAYLFVAIEDTILKLRKSSSVRDGHAFNHVEQCLFDNVISGLQALEIHLQYISAEMSGVTDANELREMIQPSPPQSTSPIRR